MTCRPCCNSLRTKAITGGTTLRFGLGIGLSIGLTVRLIEGLSRGLIVGLISGLVAGLHGGLNRGGSDVIMHYALRLILWRSGYTPFNFVKFLDQWAKLILLKKAGGSYIFIHRMLLEYFADLPTIKKSGGFKRG